MSDEHLRPCLMLCRSAWACALSWWSEGYFLVLPPGLQMNDPRKVKKFVHVGPVVSFLPINR